VNRKRKAVSLGTALSPNVASVQRLLVPWLLAGWHRVGSGVGKVILSIHSNAACNSILSIVSFASHFGGSLSVHLFNYS
jgi:hypothetical protein